MNALVPGRLAQMMATLHSIADQVAAPTLSSGFWLAGYLRGEVREGTYGLDPLTWRLLAGCGGGGLLLSKHCIPLASIRTEE